jgi:hypothetical protein
MKLSPVISYITNACMVCQHVSQLQLDLYSLESWRNGELIQNAFPDLSASQRELIMTGTHSWCWDEMFAE